MKQWEFFGLCLVLAIVADLILMYLLKKRKKTSTAQKRLNFSFQKIKSLPIKNMGVFRMKVNAVNQKILQKDVFTKTKINRLTKNQFFLIFEMFLLAGFTLYFGRPYLEMNPNVFVAGSEFAFAAASHFVWDLLPKCGTCVFWNGFINGGSPSFVELHGAFLHPLVLITTLVWGIVDGSKIILLISFFMVGFGQWWLAKELKIGFWGRIWSGLLAITGGHLFGRLEAGNVVLVLSIASASLLLPMILRFKKVPNNRNIVLLSILFALTWLSGQGYIQFVVFVAYLPVFLWYLFKKGIPLRRQWIPFYKSFLISVVLIAVLVIPVLHFHKNWTKFSNTSITDLQPIEYNVLNLVIHDFDFYHMVTLEKNIIAFAHINYIGWIPVLLMIFGLLFIQKSKRKKELKMLYFLTILVFIFSSKNFYYLFRDIPFFTQLRYIGVSTSLAVQPILGIAAFTLNKLIKKGWGNIKVGVSSDSFQIKTFSLKWLVIIFILFISVRAPYQYSRHYIENKFVYIPNEDLALLNTESTQWIRAVNYDWTPALLSNNKKLIMVDRPWFWKNRPGAKPYLQMVHNPNNDDIPESILRQGDNNLLLFPEQIYAAADTGEEITPCSANAYGGRIDVRCNTPAESTLLVHEYYLTGWQAWMDGEKINFIRDEWLRVEAPAGEHLYQFRYRPWDVYAGMGLSLFGVVWCVNLWWRKEGEAVLDQTQMEPSPSANKAKVKKKQQKINKFDL